MNVPRLLQARHVMAGYTRGMPIVHDVSLDIGAGEVVAIIGPNGAGKSTFLKAIAGLVVFEGGTVSFRAQDISAAPSHRLGSIGIGFVPQTRNVFATLTIEENLTVGGLRLSGAALRDARTRVYERFPALHARRTSPARVLSGGERQMLAVARALMTDPALIMLDEPTAGLAPQAVDAVFADLRRLAAGGVGVLLVEQNARAALASADRGYVLAEGRVYSTDSAAALLADPEIGAAFLGGARTAA